MRVQELLKIYHSLNKEKLFTELANFHRSQQEINYVEELDPEEIKRHIMIMAAFYQSEDNKNAYKDELRELELSRNN